MDKLDFVWQGKSHWDRAVRVCEPWPSQIWSGHFVSFPFSMARHSNSGRRSAADSIATRQTDNPGMRQNRLALAFQNQRWMEEVVKLEPYMVFCWCPAYYVWPYCMVCGKFCFPCIAVQAC